MPNHSTTSSRHPQIAVVLRYILLTAGAMAFLMPFYFIVNGSLKSEEAVAAGDFITPPTRLSDIHWSNYSKSLSNQKMNFSPALANTVVITTLCVFGQVLSSSLVGYGLARFRFRGRRGLFFLMLSTVMVPPQVTIVPAFVLFKYFDLIDTYWPLIIPAWLASPFFVFMFRQFFLQIPQELIDAARIDGCGSLRIYLHVMLPLSKPVIAIVSILTFVTCWNDLMGPLIYLNTAENRTLSLALNAFRGLYGSGDIHLQMAATVICVLPCVLLFLLFQRYFVQSALAGGGRQ